MRLVIGTRGSALALWQANHVRDLLEKAHPGLEVTLEVIKTTGDKITDVPLAKVGGKGLFVKEIEEALLTEKVDLAVHSLKDVPAELPERLALCAILPREDPSDALVVRSGLGPRLSDLPRGARLGTSSLRRQLQLRALRPDLVITPLRGNVDTRLRKLDEGEYDAIVLASAGLKRLGLGERISQSFSPEELLPAIGQGILGLEARKDDERVRGLIAPLHDPKSARVAAAERGVNAALAGGCQVPIAAHATLSGKQQGHVQIHALVGSPDGSVILREEIKGPAASEAEAELWGRALAERLRARGADEIIARALSET